MEAIEIARRLAELGEIKDAQNAYLAALRQNSDPQTEFEAALYLFQTEYDYRVPYTVFVRLYNAGHFQDELLELMTQAFYEPNLAEMEKRYRRNCKALGDYPYLFRRDFPDFDALPVRYFPYDERGYLPFDLREKRFGEYMAPGREIVSRNFFADLEKPVLAEDVYSQYELEYLNDMVRKSEWCAKENHVYLHYAGWTEFCCALQILDFRKLLEDQKFVFLIGEEKFLYPIDFKERFGIDYSGCQVKPFSIREIKKVVWHTQFLFHNGGDFFNEVFHDHPNLLTRDSKLFSTIEDMVQGIRGGLDAARKSPAKLQELAGAYELSPAVVRNLAQLKNATDKDILVALFLGDETVTGSLDRASRIVPALFLQPHFERIDSSLKLSAGGGVIAECSEHEALYRSGLLQGFRYVKTFTPIRRPTVSYAATNRFTCQTADSQAADLERKRVYVAGECLTLALMNRSFMADGQDRLYKDSRLVRFEDAKLNPKATFSALAAFVDLPYTESMTQCTGVAETPGFSTEPVYRLYPEWAEESERYFLEFFLRDVYAYCGYDFQSYDGAPMDEARAREMVDGFDRWKRTMIKYAEIGFTRKFGPANAHDGKPGEDAKAFALEYYERKRGFLLNVAGTLLKDLTFVNRNGQPLRFMRLLEPDPALLEQPLYH